MTAEAPTRPSEAVALHRDELVAALRGIGVVGAEVLGSVARGTDTAESDSDLIVRFGDPPPSGYQYAGALEEIERQVKVIVGSVCDAMSADDPGAERVAKDRLPSFGP